VIAVRNL